MLQARGEWGSAFISDEILTRERGVRAWADGCQWDLISRLSASRSGFFAIWRTTSLQPRRVDGGPGRLRWRTTIRGTAG